MNTPLAHELIITLTIVLLVGVAVIVPYGAAVSAAMIDRPRWEAAGRSKARWVAVLIVGVAAPLVGTVVGGVYWVFVRPRLIQDRRTVTA